MPDSVPTRTPDEKEPFGGEDAAPKPPKQPKGKWTIFDPFYRIPATPPPTSMSDAPTIPIANASFLSMLTLSWLDPILVRGFRRTLVAEDLWKMDESRESDRLADEFMGNFDSRKARVEEWNRAFDAGEIQPSWIRKLWWHYWSSSTGINEPNGRRTVGIAMALGYTFRRELILSGLFKIVGDLSQVTSPLVSKQIILFVTDAWGAHRGLAGDVDPSVGKGIGYAIGLFLMLIDYSVCQAQCLTRSAQIGVLSRGSLIAAVYRRSMVLSGKSRVTISNAKLVNHISTDISRIDFNFQFVQFTWSAFIQFIEVAVILFCTIGVPSTMAGVALVVVMFPLQTWTMRILFRVRQRAMVFTDARIKLISELFFGIRVIKLFSWETPYLNRIHEIRKKELKMILQLLSLRTANQALALSLPILCSVVVFLTYSLTGHSQDAALIWTSISLLNLLRVPLSVLPQALNVLTDAFNASRRLVPVFTCETLTEHFAIHPDEKFAIEVDHADFVWEESAPSEATGKGSKKERPRPQEKEAVEDGSPPAPSSVVDISLQVPRGEMWMICGPVGSGKSSLLQGLIGEMRRDKGSVRFGGNVSYAAQQPFIQNVSVRENILFGLPFDEDKYWRCVHDACLGADLDMLPNGDSTQIGEKGISLSGGQRQRVSLARVLYFDAEILLLDDVISALDAHVGRQVMDRAILGTLKNKTRILATHALHFMPLADRILCLDEGRIVEQGTYEELMAANGPFARLSQDYGGQATGQEGEQETPEEQEAAEQRDRLEKSGEARRRNAAPAEASEGTTTQVEERATGAISGVVYWTFFKAARGWITFPLLLVALALMQGAQSVSQFELTWWGEGKWNQSEGFYIGLYAGLGIFSSFFIFVSGVFTVIAGTTAARSLHRTALDGVVRAPASFFDTPIGRILNRFTKDVDNIDNRLNDAAKNTILTVAQIIGAFILVAIVDQWFLIGVAFCLVLYVFCSAFYRESARELKRLDNILRSALYAHFSESLAGLATIRAFGEVPRFLSTNSQLIDNENRAYFLTVCNTRWLGIRLDFIGSILVFVVAMLGVGQRYTISPSAIGMVLSAVLSIQQSLSTFVRQGTETENNLSSVERLDYYATSLEQEASPIIPEHRPPPNWPSRGGVELRNVAMSYRPGLPLVLKNMSIDIRAGEKVGVVGRTGAGKSTILMCLFRMVELSSGSIWIDGVDIAKIGLKDLRDGLAIIPQEALLFGGTIRTNLDPFGLYEDHVLWSALKRASLVDRSAADGSAQASRFNLDTVIENEGLNMSMGERSLVSLARALVKDAQIVVLDEATANVDFETDAKIQRTIATEFRDKTLITIAHRINTILSYDRVLVMDNGEVAAFDTPENLYAAGGIFFSLCTQSGITLDEIRKSQDKEA